MKSLLFWTVAGVVMLGGLLLARAVETETVSADSSARAKLIGAWRLVALDEPGADGKINHLTDRQGMLIYTADGHMSVQLMLPAADSDVSNDYVKEGYEASFGSYDVDEAAHTVTHHVQGSVTRGLVGKDLPRAFSFSNDGKLIIRSTRTDEHWSVAWEHY
ncbi:MAG TPA: lipocalin-like domain-containing protein [Candidatus Acidoferrales bacterium]